MQFIYCRAHVAVLFWEILLWRFEYILFHYYFVVKLYSSCNFLFTFLGGCSLSILSLQLWLHFFMYSIVAVFCVFAIQSVHQRFWVLSSYFYYFIKKQCQVNEQINLLHCWLNIDNLGTIFLLMCVSVHFIWQFSMSCTIFTLWLFWTTISGPTESLFNF